ncbi:CRISPR system Cascade subunit CasC [Psychromicrobium silvestre]|uniref:CRISPR system Cascade subunit CasC n=1 Tax=Psychromicrobium silvestre TaxID=1645614 RepID=A0A7Y9LUD6_9MICC|nr:CRISPR system Cascade subunit CasC [Psychromicrobium silvestre]
MRHTYIDINILQTVPPSNINRDDTGSPKSAIYGGVPRARVSSQAWKRATRKAFEGRLKSDQLGVRTKQVVELLGERIIAKAPDISLESALALATDTLTSAGVKLKPARVKKGEDPKPDESGFLFFLSSLQVNHLADAAIGAFHSEDQTAHLKSADLKKQLHLDHSVDIALFGRMVADSTDLNVDAAAQVAHALSVHAVDNEFDYYTAVDDHKAQDEEEDAGAGMIGTVEFNSSTLYRYATVDAEGLLKNLGDVEATREAVEAFVDSFVTSMPTGKQNTFANRTLPEAVVVFVRSDQPVNLVGAFEEPVEIPRLRNAADALAELSQQVDAAYRTTAEKCWVVRTSPALASLDALGAPTSLEVLTKELGELVAQRLQGKQ